MKHLISAGALLVCSAFAQAQTTHWTFSYAGFFDREAGTFLSDLRIDGSFVGVDANLDGVLERSELSSLLVGTRDYATCSGGAPGSYCGADSFRFSPNEGLSFSLGEYGGDPEGIYGGGHLIESGKLSFEYQYTPGGNFEHHLDWTEATTLSMVSVSPSIITSVPEPGEWMLLVAGLVALGIKGGVRAGVRVRFWVSRDSDPGVPSAA